MKYSSGLFAILTSLLCASSPPASADPGYRVIPIAEEGATRVAVYDLNRRGEVVGMKTVAGMTRAFRWRAGQFTDLHDTIDSASSYTQAVGINDRSYTLAVDWTNDSFEGFLLRGTQVSPLTVVAGEQQVSPLDINNRGQIIIDTYGGPQSGSFLIDGDTVQQLEGVPGESDSMNAIAINERGAILGNMWLAGGSRAALWQDGATMDLGVIDGATASFAYDLNNRNHVVGIVSIGGRSQAMHWRDGRMSLLPQLTQNQASGANSINDWGVIVGDTTILEPQFRSTATLWLGKHVVELDNLIRADDPLKPFVHLDTANEINDRGDIVASGIDSRAPNEQTTYFLTLFDN